MLGKLLKYDLKWIYKLVSVFYILALIFSIIGRLLVSIENSLVIYIIGQVCLGFAVAMMISSLINTFMRTWLRFIRNIYKDESYLTHTLPIKKSTIYLSKFLSSIIVMFTTTIVILICVIICYYSKENLESLKVMLELAATVYNSKIIWLILTIFAVFFLQITFILLVGYTGIILGHKSDSNKMIRSVIYSFVIYVLMQSISLGMIYIIGLINPGIMSLLNTVNIVDIDIIKNAIYIVITLYVVYISIYYIIGNKLFTKGVNVD